MRLSFLYILFLISIIYIEVKASNSDTLIFMGDHNYPPYEFLNEDSIPDGFNVDIINAICEAMNFNYKIELDVWTTVRSKIENGKIDALMGIFNTPQRDVLLDFSIPHFIASYAIFVRSDSDIESLDDLKDKTVLATEGDLGHDYILEKKIGNELLVRKELEDIIKDLSAGIADCAIASRLQGQELITKNEITNLKAVGLPIIQRKYSITVTEGNSALLAQLNEGLSIIKTSGEYDKIYDKWFGVYFQDELNIFDFLKYIYWLAIPIRILLISMFVSTWLQMKRNLKLYKTNIETQEELKKERDYSLDIINNSPSLICRISENGITRFINPACETITEYSARELISNNWWKILFPDSCYSQVTKLLEQLADENVRNLEMIITTKNNVKKSISWTFIKQKASDENWILGFGNDITEINEAKKKILQINQELELRVQERTAELRSVNRELKDFAHIISHDLKAPLRGINSVAKWLKEDYSDQLSPSGSDQLALLYNSSVNLGKLVNGVLEYSKAIKSEFQTEKVNLNHLLNETVDVLLPESHISIEIDKNLPTIYADKIKLQQVFLNLLSNAIKFSDKQESKIEIKHREELDYWQFSVKDNGKGIPPKYFQKIFDIFQTVDSSNKESSGIGLSIVKKITDIHKGQIWVESTLNEGSIFYFTISKSISLETANTTKTSNYS